MIDPSFLDKQCPKCCGLGRIENPTWLKYWSMHSGLMDSFRSLDTRELRTIAENEDLNQLSEPMFFVCKECSGKGKVLTDKGKRLIEFIKFWMKNY